MKKAVSFVVGNNNKSCNNYHKMIQNEMSLNNIEEIDFLYWTDDIDKDTFLKQINENFNDSFHYIFIQDKEQLNMNIVDLFDVIKKLSDKGIELWCALEGNISEQFNLITSRQDEHKTNQKISDTYELMKAKVENGYYVGGALPLGIKKTVDKKYTIDKETIHIVKDVFDLYEKGLRMINISRYIGDIYGLRYKKMYWKSRKIYDILNNPIYKGYPAWNKTGKDENGATYAKPKEEWGISKVKIEILEVIEEERFDKINKMLNQDEDFPAVYKVNP